MNPVAVFDAALRRAASGRPAAFSVRNPGGGVHSFDPAAWCRDDLPGDAAMLDRCTGPTIDVGCGPGRLVGALTVAGRVALGIDVSATAVRLAHRRGASALRRSIFEPLPGMGRWQHLLLADGNIGIGGDPVRLLRRCREVLAPGGRVHAELAAPGTASWSGVATVQGGPGDGGALLPWAAVAADDLAAPAAAADMQIVDVGTEAGRWFATLTHR